MLKLTLALALLTATSATAEGSANEAPPAPPSAADSVVAAAFGKDVVTKSAELKADSSPGLSNLVPPVLGLVGLGALAFTLRRRKQLGGGSIHIVEAASLGEKRSLVIADVLGERLVLGVSEAGVTVLMNKPAPEAEGALIVLPPALSAPVTRPMGFWARLRGKNKAPAFDAALQESIEDQELRAKLAAGFRGVVP